jgi:AcrR family transcriptional regulator
LATIKSVLNQRRSPRQARASATIGVILDATAQLVRSGNIADLTTNKIAERAGVSIGSLYFYFPNKEAILIALARRLLQEDAAAMRLALSAGGDPIRALIGTLIARHQCDPAVRNAAMAAHIGAGFGGEHVESVISAVGDITQNLFPTHAPSPARLFVITRAVLGVCRALTSGEVVAPANVLEDELVTLTMGYLGATDEPHSLSRAPAQPPPLPVAPGSS